MLQNDFDKLLEKYLKGDCSPEEELIILKWESALLETSKVALSENEKARIEAKIWSTISVNLFEKQSPLGKVVSIQRRNTFYKLFAAACVVFFLLGGGALLYYNAFSHPTATVAFDVKDLPDGYRRFDNRTAESLNVNLSDGSSVQLKAKSTLFYPTAFSGKTRNVYLNGSAFFKVAHDTEHHFIVHCKNVETEVLGTSFDVTSDANSNNIEVAVKTGKVSVHENVSKLFSFIKKPKPQVLTANQRTIYNLTNSQFVTTLVKEPKPLADLYNKPDTTKFNYQEATLAKVFAELQTAYGITIQLEKESIKNCHFTGNITKQNLYRKLDIICQSTKSLYELKGTTILIKGNGCN